VVHYVSLRSSLLSFAYAKSGHASDHSVNVAQHSTAFRHYCQKLLTASPCTEIKALSHLRNLPASVLMMAMSNISFSHFSVDFCFYDPDLYNTWSHLQARNPPLLTAIIDEGVRIGLGVTHRLQRVHLNRALNEALHYRS